MPRISRLAATALAAAITMPTAVAADQANPSGWCPPTGPTLDRIIREEDSQHMLRPGWVTLRMRVRPGAVPMTDIRVVSESGGPSHARLYKRLVSQWQGCAANTRDTQYQVKFTFAGYQGHERVPEHEGFGLYAFAEPQGEPALPAGDSGLGVCPVKARLQINQPRAANVVIQLESGGGEPVRAWLESLRPDLGYMAPHPDSNRVEFPCKVTEGKVTFFER